MRHFNNFIIGIIGVVGVCGGVGETLTAESASLISITGSKDPNAGRLSNQLDSIQEDVTEIKALLEDLKGDQTDIIQREDGIIKLLEPLPEGLCEGGIPGQRWVTTEDGKEVCDATTGIYWQQNPGVNNNGNEVDWFDAKNGCETFAKFDLNPNHEYRLPEEEDLYGIFDHDVDGPPRLPSNVFDGIKDGLYWTNTEGGANAIGIRIIQGTLVSLGGHPKTDSTESYGWCVRSD